MIPRRCGSLLSRYFDRCRSLIERYGGTVEKFIGDAVMAVWVTPIAREDDAERAVRVGACPDAGGLYCWATKSPMPECGFAPVWLTGNAAVELGAEGEGMVLGDTVNTASRLHRGELARAQELLGAGCRVVRSSPRGDCPEFPGSSRQDSRALTRIV